MGNSLRRLRDDRRWTAEKAASEFGMSRSGYLKLERGERRLNDQHIATAVRVYEVPASEILGESTLTPSAETPTAEQPAFAGFVQAGMFSPVNEYFQQDEFEVPEFVVRQRGYPRVRQYCYQVRGNSMNQAGIDDGMWIVAADAGDYIDNHGDLESGDFVVVERTRYQGAERELTVKEIRYYRDRYELVPHSDDDTHKTIVVPHDHKVSTDEIEVRIVGVLLTAYRDFRRSRR